MKSELIPEIGQRKQVSGPFSTITPAHTLDELSSHPGLGSSCGRAPHYNKGCLSQRTCTVAGDQGGLDLGQRPNRSGAITAGACKGGGLGQAGTLTGNRACVVRAQPTQSWPGPARSTAELHIRARAALAVESVAVEAGASSGPMQHLNRERQPWWVLTAVWYSKMVPEPPGRAPRAMTSAHTCPSCFSPPRGQVCQCWEGEHTYSEKTEPAQTWSSGLVFQQHGTWSHPQSGGTGHRAEEKPQLTPDSGSTHPSLSLDQERWKLPALHGGRCNHVHIKSSSSNKGTWYWLGMPQHRHPYETAIGTCFTKFQRQRKLSKITRQKNLLHMKEPDKTHEKKTTNNTGK